MQIPIIFSTILHHSRNSNCNILVFTSYMCAFPPVSPLKRPLVSENPIVLPPLLSNHHQGQHSIVAEAACLPVSTFQNCTVILQSGFSACVCEREGRGRERERGRERKTLRKRFPKSIWWFYIKNCAPLKSQRCSTGNKWMKTISEHCS